MSAHVEEEHFAGSNKLFTSIWVWLVVLTLVEIGLAYKPMALHLMLTILLGLSIIKAALIVAYFMHLKFERLSLILTIAPTGCSLFNIDSQQILFRHLILFFYTGLLILPMIAFQHHED